MQVGSYVKAASRWVGLAWLALLAAACINDGTRSLCDPACEGSTCLDPRGTDCQSVCMSDPSRAWCDTQLTDSSTDPDASSTARDSGVPEPQRCDAAHPCETPARPFCGPEGLCVQCEASDDCSSPSAPRCQKNECVGCSSELDCRRFPTRSACGPKGACVECTEADDQRCQGTSTPFCNPDTSRCVECVEHRDCPDPNASMCDPDTNTCVPCAPDVQGACDHIPDQNACFAGACVECAGEQRKACQQGDVDYVCDPATHTCSTDHVAREARTCEPCISDFECRNKGDLCVATTFTFDEQTLTLPGAFCLPVRERDPEGKPLACSITSPPFIRESDQVSVDGNATGVCALRASTCAAFREFDIVPCSPGEHRACGDDALGTDDDNDSSTPAPTDNDGYCVERGNSGVYRCTMRCSTDEDCQDEGRCGFVGGIGKFCELP